MTPEGQVLAAILKYLEVRQIFAWRNNTGSVQRLGSEGKMHSYRYGRKGSSDILGILNNGRFLAIEVKAPKGRATPEQLAFLDDIKKRGGVAFIARSIEDVERELFLPRLTNFAKEGQL